MYVVVFVTASSIEEAKKIARQLLIQKLAACVNILNGIESMFWWEGKIDHAGEVLLMIKSRKSNMAKIVKVVKSLHSYQVPEIIALPILSGNKEYLEWIDASTR